MYKLLTTILIATFFAGFTQTVSFKALGPGAVSTGDAFYLQYQVNAQGSNLKLPDIGSFEMLGGPSTSQSSNIQIVNGNMTQTVTFTYTYTLKASKEGKFTIPGAKITVSGKEYTSNSVVIEVVKGTPKTNNQNNSNQGTTASPEISGSDLYMSVILSKSKLYQGEHLVATVKIFSKVNLVDLGKFNAPKFNGFLKHDLSPDQIQLKRENVNGQIYNTAIIQQFILIPQKAGKLTIDPADIECIVQYKVNSGRTSLMDEFFGRNMKNVQKTIYSSPVTVDVKALPGGAPDDFNGAVGQLKLESNIDNTDISTNDAITLTYTVSGQGNLRLIDPFEIDFPVDFEKYDPKVVDNVNITMSGSSGSKSFEYVIIPRHAGKFTIPAVTFSYFDPASGTYKTLKSEEYTINVKKGSGDEEATVITGVSKEDVKYLGKDIRFIKIEDYSLSKKDSFIYGSASYFLSFPAALLAFIVILFLKKNQLKKRSDIVYVKNKKARKMAMQRLNNARALMQSGNEQFYDEVLKSVWGYFSFKLNIPLSDLNKDAVINGLTTKNIDGQYVSKLSEILDKCEYARYAPTSVGGGMQEIYNETLKLISEIEGKINK
ncbi:MAG: hypothetical protein A2W91_01590 [Bacteroidetes bacterium GWF2_38_335]|nr:MAG: hypothetical protein A2W91_01590 [Bacteroidetes bacterium GWF2_38_335]OFY78765.1 MAG: hypothetical protein A2281_19165 [Bacteroidetes bacterium RIFOXYA12_FULL_38_20]HBS85156.1 hypothetical protein [Bacteroidales bacterium]